MAGTDGRSAAGEASGARVVALDYGSARCGFAVSDPSGTLATPLDAVLRPATRKGFNRLLAAIRAQQPARVVVGLPLSLSGRDSAQTTRGARVRGAPGSRSSGFRSSSTTSASRPRSRSSDRERRRRTHAPRRCCWRTGWPHAADRRSRARRSRSGPIWAIKRTTVPFDALPAWISRRPTRHPAPRPPPRPAPPPARWRCPAPMLVADDPLDILLKQIIGGWFHPDRRPGRDLEVGRARRDPVRQGCCRGARSPVLRAPARRAAERRRRAVARLPRRRRPAARPRARRGHRAPCRDRHAVPARGRVRARQARRGLRLLALPGGPRVRAADEHDAGAHAPAAPGRRARDAGGDRRGAAGLGRLADRGHDGRVPSARPDPVGGGGAAPARAGAGARGRRARRGDDDPVDPGCRRARSATSTTPPR